MIKAAKTFPVKINFGIINLNFIKQLGSSCEAVLELLSNRGYTIKKDGDINIVKKIINTDQAGLTAIRVINLLCMPLFIKDSNSLIIYLVNMINTETKVLQMFNQFDGEPRLKFIIAYFNRLNRGKLLPDKVLLSLKNDKQVMTGNNISIKIKNNTNNKKFKRNKNKGNKKSFITKSSNNNKIQNNNNKKEKPVGDINHQTFNSQ